jgi:hypothetical protein
LRCRHVELSFDSALTMPTCRRRRSAPRAKCAR